MKKKQDIRKKLNLNYLNLTNKTYSSGEDDLPAIYCNTPAYPDFLALSGQPGLYWKTCLAYNGFTENRKQKSR